MKKLPEITMTDWINAEAEMKNASCQSRPPGSITPQEYSEARGCGKENAQKLLREMVEAGLATRQKWYNGVSGTRYLYLLKTKKPKNKKEK